MELVKILRELMRRKLLLGIVLGVALLVGLLMAFRPGIPPHSRQYEVSLASADVLIDTRDSQAVSVNGHGPGLLTLASRANLLGNLMTGGPLKTAIARNADVDPELLAVIPPGGTAASTVETPAGRARSDAEATILSLSTDETLPILHVVAQAPDPETARRLAAATIVELKAYLGSAAGAQKIPAVQQLVVRKFGTPVISSARRGLPRKDALLAALGIAFFGSAAIVIGSWFSRNWKKAKEDEDHDVTGRDDGDDGSTPESGNGRPEHRRKSAGRHGPALPFRL